MPVQMTAEGFEEPVRKLLGIFGQVGIHTKNSTYMLFKVGSRYALHKIGTTPEGKEFKETEYLFEDWNFVFDGSKYHMQFPNGEKLAKTSKIRAIVVPMDI